jgi:FSR family fosmidomycin resistance protein-like MFS transporter
MQLVFGSLSDKGYRKQLIAFGILATTAATLLAYTDNYIVLCVVFLVTCLGSGAFHPAAASWMGALTQHYKGLFITLFTCGGTLGIALSQIIFYQAFYSLQGHTIFLAVPVVLLVAFLTFSSLKPTEQVVGSSQEKFNLRVFGDFFRRRDLALLYISQVCNQSVCWGSIFLLPDILLWREYDSWICFGGAHLSFVMGSFFMQPLAGYLADRYSCRTVILSAIVIGMTLFYIFLFNPMIESSLLLILLFFLGAAMGLVNPVSLAWGARLVPENPGMISAFLMGMVWCVSEGIGQGGGGLLSKLFVDDAPAKALSLIGSTFIMGFAAVLLMPKESPVASAVKQV